MAVILNKRFLLKGEQNGWFLLNTWWLWTPSFMDPSDVGTWQLVGAWSHLAGSGHRIWTCLPVILLAAPFFPLTVEDRSPHYGNVLAGFDGLFTSPFQRMCPVLPLPLRAPAPLHLLSNSPPPQRPLWSIQPCLPVPHVIFFFPSLTQLCSPYCLVFWTGNACTISDPSDPIVMLHHGSQKLQDGNVKSGVFV